MLRVCGGKCRVVSKCCSGPRQRLRPINSGLCSGIRSFSCPGHYGCGAIASGRLEPAADTRTAIYMAGPATRPADSAQPAGIAACIFPAWPLPCLCVSGIAQKGTTAMTDQLAAGYEGTEPFPDAGGPAAHGRGRGPGSGDARDRHRAVRRARGGGMARQRSAKGPHRRLLGRTSSSSTAPGPTVRAGAPSSSACKPTATRSRRPSSRSPRFARRMGATTVEVPAGHVAMVSHPDDVAQLIKTAAEAVQTAY